MQCDAAPVPQLNSLFTPESRKTKRPVSPNMDIKASTYTSGVIKPSGGSNGSSSELTAVDTSSHKTASHSTPSIQTSSQPTQPSATCTESKQEALRTNSVLKAELSSVQARILELNQTLHHLQHSLHQQQHPSGVGGKTPQHLFAYVVFCSSKLFVYFLLSFACVWLLQCRVKLPAASHAAALVFPCSSKARWTAILKASQELCIFVLLPRKCQLSWHWTSWERFVCL